MTFGRIWLGFNGLIFFLYGLACLFAPNLPAGYAGMELPTASARNEVAAMYGGLQAGLGALLLWSAVQVDRIRVGLLVLVVLLGSLALGRLVGLVFAGPTSYNVAALVYELSAAGLGYLAWRRMGPEPGIVA